MLASQFFCCLAGGAADCGCVLLRHAMCGRHAACSGPRARCAQVLVPASQFLRSLVAARLAADVCGVPTVLIARTDAHSASLLTADIDEVDRPFLTGTRTPEGFYGYRHGIKARIPLCNQAPARALASAATACHRRRSRQKSAGLAVKR